MKYVSINGNVIRRRGDRPIRIARTPSDAKPIYANEIELIGPSRLRYDPERRIMRCGARLIIECADVNVIR